MIRKVYYLLNKPYIKIIVLILLFIFSFIYLENQYDEIVNIIQTTEINKNNIFIALFLVLLTIFQGTLTWRAILSWLNFKKPWGESAKGYAISSLAKYIPGFIWQYTGRVYFSHELSIPIKVIGYAIFAEFLLSILDGSIIACFSYILSDLQYFQHSYFNLIITGILILFILALVLLPRIFRKVFNKSEDEKNILLIKYYYLSILFNISGWILMGFSYWLIVSSLEIPKIPFISAMFMHSASFVAGSIALPVPNGLVIREAVLALLNNNIINDNFFILSSIIFRILILLGEIIFTFIIISIQFIRSRDAH